MGQEQLPGGMPIFEVEDLYVEQVADYLAGRRITCVVTSGIAAMVVPRVIRQLRRYGAEVQVIMSWTASELFGKTMFEWASARPVISGLTGLAEHIRVKDDLALVLPATLNTVAQMARGQADGPATTYLASTLGLGIPVVLVPAMHRSMFRNPFFQENLERLLELPQVTLVPPRIEEGKAKLADVEEIAARVTRAVARDPLRDVGVLITAGPTRGYLDPIRFITNISSGELGVRLAADLYHRGARVRLVYGPGRVQPPPYLDVVKVETPAQMLEASLEQLGTGDYRVGVFAAAVGDYVPAEVAGGKIASGRDSLELRLVPTVKIIRAVDEVVADDFFKVGFKLESGLDQAALLERGFAALSGNRCRLLVANDATPLAAGQYRGYVLSPERTARLVRSKAELVETLAKMIGFRIQATYYRTTLESPEPLTVPAAADLAQAVQALAAEDLAEARGSVSVRLKGERFLITARDVALTEFDPDRDIVEVVAVDHEARTKVCRGHAKGAADLLSHDLIYQERSEIGGIVQVVSRSILDVAGELGLVLVDTPYPPSSMEHAFELLRALEGLPGPEAVIAVRDLGVYAIGPDLAAASRQFRAVLERARAFLRDEERLAARDEPASA